MKEINAKSKEQEQLGSVLLCFQEKNTHTKTNFFFCNYDCGEEEKVVWKVYFTEANCKQIVWTILCFSATNYRILVGF